MNKVALALASTVVSGGLAILVLSLLKDPEGQGTVKSVDTTAMMMEVLDEGRERAASAPKKPIVVAKEPVALPPLIHYQPLSDKALSAYFPAAVSPQMRRSEFSYFKHKPNGGWTRRFEEHPKGKFSIQLNGAGMRETTEVRDPKPGLRVLFTGDSHVAGVVNHDENLVHLLETSLSANGRPGDVETLNLAVGSYCIYNYLGVLEDHAHLEPDVFVVVVYGGNDFYGMVRLERYFSGRGRYAASAFSTEEQRKAWDGLKQLRAQELVQVRYMEMNQEDVSIAAQTSASILDEIGDRCDVRGILPIFVYLPPPLEVQADRFPAEVALATTALGLTKEELTGDSQLADEMIRALKDKGRSVVDLRPAYRKAEELLYWRLDFHINLAGHRIASEVIAPYIEEALAGR